MSLSTNVANLATRVATEFKTIRTLITGSAAGDLTGLQTTVKTSLVDAINEARTTGGSSVVDATETVKGVVELASLAEHATGTDALRAATVAGVRQERIALKAEILGADVPSALDTLDELAAALGDDPNLAASTTTALGNRVRVDAAQGLTSPQMTQGRANIDAASATEVGSTTADYVAAFNAALV